jgi:hypothetical protein
MDVDDSSIEQELPDAAAAPSSSSNDGAYVPVVDPLAAAAAAKKTQDQANAKAKRLFDQENGWNRQCPGFRFYIGEDNAGRIECTLCEVRVFILLTQFCCPQ